MVEECEDEGRMYEWHGKVVKKVDELPNDIKKKEETTSSEKKKNDKNKLEVS